jgi:hypothetical protein
MEIKTKYNIGDTVWFISENRAKSGIITQPTTFHPVLNRNDVYDLTDFLGWRLDLVEFMDRSMTLVRRREKDLFSTKEELLKSMLDPDEPIFDLRNDE